MMDDYELLLLDRIKVIQEANKKYDLENNAYISFSGGKDSTVLSVLVDLALPNNKLADNDNRFIMLKPTQPIQKMLQTYGYPFKSKQHSHNVSIYQHSKGLTTTTKKYLGLDGCKSMYKCPKNLEYQFTPEFNIKLSDRCCYKMKKEPAHKWQVENGKSITLTGMQKSEGGNRNNLTCIVTNKDGSIKKFHPLAVVDDKFEEWELCELYNAPFNFKRTGCKGCPFALNLQEELDTMEKYLPAERKQCEMLWKPVYEEYRRLGYRLRKNDNG